ncbi:hypothetical protein GF391_03260 [Candidatus Uhrbacteria bacterium]|nr:hypothetical protein [Candidatus Uhrbacteria bacterium]
MKYQIEEDTNKYGRLSRSSRMFLVLLGPLLLCITGVVHLLVPPIILFSTFWILGLTIFSFIQFFAWSFGLVWYKDGGIKAIQNGSYIKKLQNKENKVEDLFGFITALSIAIAIVPYLVILLLIILLSIFAILMEGGPLD